jgi:molybdopterin-containing oxidoreductase family membrane subunit
VGVLGVNNQVPWGLDIVHFVFWIGIGHAGTLISAVLLLARQQWRHPIARGAELMTLCAVVCAAIYPLVHVGRIALAWLVNPFPDPTDVWLDPASPLIWDVLAVTTYFTLSVLYCYVGAIPDFAQMRDEGASTWKSKLSAILAMGWRGTVAQWVAHHRLCFLLALILTPLVVSVHSVVSLDFAVTQHHGWHETVFPPYFVAGAVLSGMAMVQILLCVVQKVLRPEGVESLSTAIIDKTSRFVLAFSWIMFFMYLWEAMGNIGAGSEAWTLFAERFSSPSGVIMIVGNILLPQLYWLKPLRCSFLANILVALGVLVGMWAERWVIVVHSLNHALLGSDGPSYVPTVVDISMGVGSLALFMALFMMVTALVPFFPSESHGKEVA